MTAWWRRSRPTWPALEKAVDLLVGHPKSQTDRTRAVNTAAQTIRRRQAKQASPRGSLQQYIATKYGPLPQEANRPVPLGNRGPGTVGADPSRRELGDLAGGPDGRHGREADGRRARDLPARRRYRADPPASRAEEAAFIVGRRGGKDRAATVLATYIAGLCDHSDALVAGERGILLYGHPDGGAAIAGDDARAVDLISTPYARRGELWEMYRRYFGAGGDPSILVVQGAARDFNSTLPQSVVDRALERDHAASSAEYLAIFRTDIESFVAREAVEACISWGVRERPPCSGTRYYAYGTRQSIAAAFVVLSWRRGYSRRVLAGVVERVGSHIVP